MSDSKHSTQLAIRQLTGITNLAIDTLLSRFEFKTKTLTSGYRC